MSLTPSSLDDNRFNEELIGVSTLISIALLVAGYTGWWGWIFFIAFMIYLGRNFYFFFEFLSLVRSHALEPRHAPFGIWGDIYDTYFEKVLHDQRSLKRLRMEAEQIQQAMNLLPDAHISLNDKHRIEWVNTSAESMLGLRKQDAGQKITNLLRQNEVANYFDKGDFTKTVDFYSSLESSRRLSAQMVPYFDEHYLLIIRDITEMHNINQIRRDFVANASHELRTPLTVIVGYLEYILDNMETAPKSWHFLLNQMNAQSGRMINIINDLLELSTLERDELEEVEELIDINKLTLELYHSAIALSHGQHQISMDVTQEMTVFASYKSFNSSFTNLITNAIRYTPEGGEIHIRCYYDEDGLYFEVKDTGIGIAREDISRITERFYRANTDRSRQTGGTGLGLSIVKHALERYNGRLEITSRLQVGSTFRCVFPASLLVSPETHPELFAKKA